MNHRPLPRYDHSTKPCSSSLQPESRVRDKDWRTGPKGRTVPRACATTGLTSVPKGDWYDGGGAGRRRNRDGHEDDDDHHDCGGGWPRSGRGPGLMDAAPTYADDRLPLPTRGTAGLLTRRGAPTDRPSHALRTPTTTLTRLELPVETLDLGSRVKMPVTPLVELTADLCPPLDSAPLHGLGDTRTASVSGETPRLPVWMRV